MISRRRCLDPESPIIIGIQACCVDGRLWRYVVSGYNLSIKIGAEKQAWPRRWQ